MYEIVVKIAISLCNTWPRSESCDLFPPKRPQRCQVGGNMAARWRSHLCIVLLRWVPSGCAHEASPSWEMPPVVVLSVLQMPKRQAMGRSCGPKVLVSTCTIGIAARSHLWWVTTELKGKAFIRKNWHKRFPCHPFCLFHYFGLYQKPTNK